jgi:hypothetical protein
MASPVNCHSPRWIAAVIASMRRRVTFRLFPSMIVADTLAVLGTLRIPLVHGARCAKHSARRN